MTQLQPDRMQLAEFARAVYTVVPEVDTPFDALLDPGYWAHVAAKLAPWARIEVQAEDGSYFAELLVQDAGRLFAKVAVLRHVELTAVEVTGMTSAAGYAVKWRGPKLKWSVMRGGDALKDELPSKDEANNWLTGHLKAVA